MITSVFLHCVRTSYILFYCTMGIRRRWSKLSHPSGSVEKHLQHNLFPGLSSHCSRRLYRYFICLHAFYACIRGSTFLLRQQLSCLLFYCAPFLFFEQDHYIASDLLVLPGPAARGIYLHQRLRTGGNRRQGNGYRRGNPLPAYLAACLLLQPVLYRIYKKAEVR